MERTFDTPFVKKSQHSLSFYNVRFSSNGNHPYRFKVVHGFQIFDWELPF